MSTLSYLRIQPSHERRLFVKAIIFVVLTRLAVATLSLRQLRAFLSWVAERSAAPQAHDDYAQRVARAVTHASALVPGTGTLTSALAISTLIRCRGLVGNLRLMAHYDDQGRRSLEARLTYKGQILVGGPAIAPPCPGDEVWRLGPPDTLPAFAGEGL